MTDTWDVWFVHYCTYEEIAASGILQEQYKRPGLVERGLSFERAQRLADRIGFGACIKPSEGRR